MVNLGISALVRRTVAALTRSRRDRDLREEIEGHIEMRRQRLVDDGLDPREADREARRMLGNVTGIREKTRDEWGFTAIEALVQDLRYGLGMMGRSHGFSSVAY